MDLPLALAEPTGADLVIANDPDADRCAVAVPGRRRLADAARRRGRRAARPTHARCAGGGCPTGRCVLAHRSSRRRCCGAMRRARGARYAETLTGFKWIVRGDRRAASSATRRRSATASARTRVRDKDGISAALLVAELAATLKAEGRTLADRLDELAARARRATPPTSSRSGSSDLSRIGAIMARLRAAPPTALGGVAVARVDDLARGDGGLPPTDVLRFSSPTAAGVIMRPSGTEPKLKSYYEVVVPVTAEVAARPASARPAAGHHPRPAHRGRRRPLARLDAEDRMPVGHRREHHQWGAHRYPHVRAAARHLLDVAGEHRGPLVDRYLDEVRRAPAAAAQHDVAAGHAHVAGPGALAEHRHGVPAPVDVGQAEREGTQPAGDAPGHLEGGPAAWAEPARDDPRPAP